MSEKLYFCDGKACGGIPEYCYRNGGECCHATNPEHSLSKKYGDKFPPTLFIPWHETDIHVEEINVSEFLKCLVEGHIYNFPEGFIS